MNSTNKITSEAVNVIRNGKNRAGRRRVGLRG